MKIAKRIFLFAGVNILIITTISIVLTLLGVQPYLSQSGLNYGSLAVFCLIWGFGGAFISLGLSRIMAKWMMGVKIIDASVNDMRLRGLVEKVHALAEKAGLGAMPEVGIYESPDINAFATGPTEKRSLIAVSTGLLARMDDQQVSGVLSHEISHIANGDMVTMTLLQGVVNAFVMFLARIAGFFAGQMVDEQKRPMIQIFVVFISQILLGILGMVVVSAFSRAREFRADAGGADLAGTSSMIAALQALKANLRIPVTVPEGQAAIATLKISGKGNRFLSLFSTHPDLDTRIEKLQQRQSFSLK